MHAPSETMDIDDPWFFEFKHGPEQGKRMFESMRFQLALQISRLKHPNVSWSTWDAEIEMIRESHEEEEFIELNLGDLQQSVQCFNELRFKIKGNHGKLSVRLHDLFHGKRPKRAVMVSSRFSKTLCSDLLALVIVHIVQVDACVVVHMVGVYLGCKPADEGLRSLLTVEDLSGGADSRVWYAEVLYLFSAEVPGLGPNHDECQTKSFAMVMWYVRLGQCTVHSARVYKDAGFPSILDKR